jgi:ubiquinone/menaquinone biosynthesis C-methylase UbiE
MTSLVCPVDLDTRRLREEIAGMYARVAADPSGEFHFHRGPEYAAGWLGYDAAELASLPASTTASFAGVANPIAIGPMHEGETVIDIGSGAGMDLLLAARRVGPTGRAVGIDSTPEMIEKCRASAREAGLSNVEVRAGDVHALPVDSESVDVVISNGVLNLAWDKLSAFREVVRVLKRGGRLMLGDIVVRSELSEGIRKNYELWAA